MTTEPKTYRVSVRYTDGAEATLNLKEADVSAHLAALPMAVVEAYSVELIH